MRQEAASPHRTTDRPLIALFWMSMSAIGFAFMGLFVKRLARELPQFELVFFRSLINFLVVLIPLLQGHRPLWIPSHWKLLVFRGVMGFAGVSCLFYTLATLPLSVAIMVQWTSPLFVLLFSRVFLRETLPKGSSFLIASAFVGLLLLLEPKQSGTTLPALALTIGVAGAAFAGLAYVAVRAATATVGTNTIILYFSGISTLFSSPLAAAQFQLPSLSQGFELLLMGLAGAFGQYAMTLGFALAPAGLVSTMSLLSAAVSAILGWLFFSEQLGALQWFGMVVLGFSIMILGLLARPTPRQR